MIYREDYADAASYLQARIWERRRKWIILGMSVFTVVTLGVSMFFLYFQVTDVEVEGNTRYTNEEIEEYVTQGILGDNTIVLSFRYGSRVKPDLPFIESMDVSVTGHDSIRVRVYERALAGYVTYLGRYMYFSRDGTVVETSATKLTGIPEVTGLKYDYVVLYEPLPVTDPEVFGRILTLTQLLAKYELSADRIYFDTRNRVSVYFGKIRATLGNDDYTDEKLNNISRILPLIKGQEGTLQLTNYNSDTEYISFVRRKVSSTGAVELTSELIPSVTKVTAEGLPVESDTAAEPEAGTSEEAEVSGVVEKIPEAQGESETGWESIP